MDTIRKRILCACALMFAFALITTESSAQQTRGAITGTITNQVTGQPLPAVQVFVVGTQLGGLTDQRGRYLVQNVPAGAHQVRATILGYAEVSAQVNVSAGGTATADFALRETAVELGGIVVNAITGEQVRRRELGNSVGNIEMANVDKAAITRPADILTARVAGVEVRNINGTTGTGQKIRIRGANSVSLSNEPLIIVDGVRFDNGTDFMDSGFSEGSPDQVPNRLNDLNPDDIESIEVLKGPAASGIYGTAASNGVILIRTKRGSAGPSRWTAYAEGGVVQEKNEYPDNIAALFRRANGTFGHCRNYQRGGGACAQDSIARFNPFTNEDFSPFREGDRQKYGLSVAGGSDQVTYYVSGDMEKEDGIYTSNFVEKYNIRANLRALVRSNMTFNVSTSYISSDFSQPSNDNSLLSPILNGMFGRAFFDHSNRQRAYYQFAPEVTAEQYFATQEIDRAVASVNGNWQPFSWLSVNGTGGMDIFSLHDSQLLEPNVAPIAATWVNGWAEESRGTVYSYTGNLAGLATYRLTDAIVSSSTVGVDYNRQKTGATRAKGFGVTPGTSSLDGTAALFQIDEDNAEVITIGGFLQQQLAFNDRIFVTGALRADDNSAFGQDFGLIYYPSATASWVVSDESFFPQTGGILSSLRVRGALGESGQRPQFRQAETFFSPATAATETGDVPGVTVGGTGNLDLKPERTREIEAGFDAGLLNERFGAEFTFFQRTTRDALIARNLPPSLGQTNPATASGTRFENIGEVRNRGIELALNARVIELEPVKWSVRVSGSTLKNEIVELGEGIDPIILNRGLQKHIAGYTAGGYWQPLVEFNDADGDGFIDANEYSVEDTTSFIGPSLPEMLGSISSELQIFDFLRVSALFEGRAGHYNHNNTEDFRCLFSALTADRGCTGFDDPTATLEQQASALASVFGDPNTADVSSYYHIYKADFLKWRELAFTLTPPRSLLQRLRGVSGLSLTIAGRNLKTWTDYPGLDPEINETGSASNFTQGEFGTQPLTRHWTARLNITF
ncbi:MAG: SusC/RagA family TonB-linked outer membrane protein [Longimicrobiales bacterium]